MSENPFNITREELLDLAATKLADRYAEDEDLAKSIDARISARIREAFSTGLGGRIDAFLSEEMNKLISKEIIPVDVWGDKVGTPTTIRAALYKRAEEYWQQWVDSSGNPVAHNGYGSIKRHEFLYRKFAGEAFEHALKQNIVDVLGALKDTIRADAQKNIDTALNELLRVKSLKEQGK